MLNKYLNNSGIFKEFNEVIHKDKFTLNLTHSSEDFNIYLIFKMFQEGNSNIFVNASSLYKAQRIYDKLSRYYDEVLFFPFDDFVNDELLASSNEFRFERINTIVNLLKNKKSLVVTHTSSLARLQLPRSIWQDSIRSIKKNDIIDTKKLAQDLVSYGFTRKFTVENKGEFGVRGSIVDIYPYSSEKPFRIDLFDDEVDSIRTYDPVSQKSLEKAEVVEFHPVNEFFYNVEEQKTLINTLGGLGLEVDQVIQDVENFENMTRLHKYIPLIHKKVSILDLVEDKTVFYFDFDAHMQTYKGLINDLEDFLENNLVAQKLALPIFLDSNELILDSKKNIFSTFESKNYQGLKYTDDIALYARDFISTGVENLIQDNQMTTLLFVRDKRQRERVKEYLENKELPYVLVGKNDDFYERKINIIEDNIFTSFELIKQNVKVISIVDIFKEEREQKIRYKSVLKQEQRINDLDEIKPGDYIVHYDYGIGRYHGVKTMELGGIKGDYITVVYKGEDSLYIPVEKIKLLSKYVASEGTVPKLNKLGGTDWQKTKQKVRTKIKELAIDLVKLYAEREAAKGFVYSHDSREMIEFESDFAYQETEDQYKAIQDIKKDMHSTRPMDRLICGDVGYGKTEVAMRAAFKACMDGKQVAYLAPTTVLSRQHYQSFIKRFEKYGLRVELINRFVTPQKVRDVIKGIQEGYVDVVIGTHRLLSSDIKFKDLGLLIVDEEQRFGVEHKEIIKTMKVNVDVLTLTATPIPRTLQMSIMGIKDISILNTPPKNRYPVQTYVLDFDKNVVKNAVERELARDGQVFILYNKTSDIDAFSNQIQSLVSGAKVRFAHGKMSRDELEDAITSFTNKEYNVLVCTTIIETGIDIPNANTIIITDADRLGLSQLYQIRGRVGRSDKIAYAYLMYKKDKTINEEAAKRLKAIKEFTELGSGFKIAMRDLSIRGAGDVLGSEQSGFIDGVGMDLYMKMLEEEVKILKGEKPDEEVDEALKFRVATHISDDYISDESVKIEIHRKIDSIRSFEELIELKKELEDRFGALSEDNYIYLEEKLFENYTKEFNVVRVDKTRNNVTVRLSEDTTNSLDGVKLFEYCSKLSKNIRLVYKGKHVDIIIDTLRLEEHYLIILNKIFQSLK